MALTERDVRGIADYARIALDQDELPQMTKYMNDVVATLQPIREYDLDDVEPTFHPIGGLVNVMREDVPTESLSIEEALKDATSTDGRSFKVPTILGGGE